MLSPEEIENSKLPRAVVGGYKPDGVAEHLRRVAWDFRKLLHERSATESELSRVQGELARSKRRDELESAVIESAQQAAREIRETARHDAEVILKKAREHAVSLLADAESQHAARTREIEKLKETGSHVRSELRTLVTSLLSVLEPPGSVDPERRHVMEDLERVVQATRAAAAKPTWGERLRAMGAGSHAREPLGNGDTTDDSAFGPSGVGLDENRDADALAVPGEGSTGDAERVA